MDCAQELLSGTQITLVDDIVTRGSTMAGCILRLRAVYGPEIQIDGFALGRVEARELQQVAEMLSPKVEKVSYDGFGSLERF